MSTDSNAGNDNGIISKIISVLVGLIIMGLGIWLVGDALGLLMISLL